MNGLKNSPELTLEKEEIQSALEKCGLSADVRGEDLSLEQFAKLADIFAQK